MMDLSKLSTADLEALESGDLTKVSTEGLSMLGGAKPPQVDITPDMSAGEKFWAGAGQSVVNTGRGVKQLFDQGAAALERQFDPSGSIQKKLGQPTAQQILTDTNQGIREAREIDAPLLNTGWGKAGQIAGDVATWAIPGTKAAKAMTFPRALGRVAPYAAAAATNAGIEALRPVLDNESRGENAAWGGVTGVIGQGVGNALASGVRGAVRVGRQALRLPQEVREAMTLGQIADPNSIGGRFASGVEEKLTSLPLVGDAIKNARRRGEEAWRGDVFRRAAPPGYTPQGDTTREVMEGMQDEFGRQYSGALRGQSVGPSRTFEQSVLASTNNPRAGLTPAQQQEIQNLVMSYYNNMFQGPVARTGADTAKEFERFLTAQARQYRRSNTPQAQNMAQVFDDIESAWTGAYRNQLTPATQTALQPIDRQYAPFKTVERASSSLANEAGDFTPAQLLNAVKARTTAGEFAAGNGMLQDTADAGRATLQSRTGNSGTTDRALAASLLGGLVLDPVSTASGLATAGAVAIPALTTRTGKNLLTGNTRLQRMLQRMYVDKALENSGPLIGQSFSDLANPDPEY